MKQISQDERERAVFRSRRMYRTDLASDLATAEDRGRREGMREGERSRSMAIAVRMLRRNTPVDDIMDITELSREEIEELRHGL